MSRYINVTLIDATGTASSTQLWTNRPGDALSYIEENIDSPREFVSAYVYDTMTLTLTKFDILGRAYVVRR